MTAFFEKPVATLLTTSWVPLTAALFANLLPPSRSAVRRTTLPMPRLPTLAPPPIQSAPSNRSRPKSRKSVNLLPPSRSSPPSSSPSSSSSSRRLSISDVSAIGSLSSAVVSTSRSSASLCCSLLNDIKSFRISIDFFFKSLFSLISSVASLTSICWISFATLDCSAFCFLRAMSSSNCAANLSNAPGIPVLCGPWTGGGSGPCSFM